MRAVRRRSRPSTFLLHDDALDRARVARVAHSLLQQLRPFVVHHSVLFLDRFQSAVLLVVLCLVGGPARGHSRAVRLHDTL